MTYMCNLASTSFNVDSISYLPNHLNDIDYMTSPDLDCCHSKMINYTGQFIHPFWLYLCVTNPLSLMKTCTRYVLYIPHCMFFVCTCALTFILYMQLTLLIHINSMSAINTSHLLSPGTWLMIPVIGHQRRSVTVILSKLTCDFRICHQSIKATPMYCFKWCCYLARHDWSHECLLYLQ